MTVRGWEAAPSDRDSAGRYRLRIGLDALFRLAVRAPEAATGFKQFDEGDVECECEAFNQHQRWIGPTVFEQANHLLL
jgi:hypothetical protein